uniref:Speckle-type POZ protein-like protein n=1 Tax=Aegilops tauschii TaxID=37682 RepID=M8BLQ3_AEGTA
MKTCKTVSMCTPLEEAQGIHVFDIFGYSKHKGMGHEVDSYIRSGIFSVGGHDWEIFFYPDGHSEIEGSAYLRDDRLTIECVGTVFKKPHVTETKSFPKISMPPAGMTEDVAKLLEEKKGFDVGFIVGGETIEAHRFVLAMRSPVFEAELMGRCRRRGRDNA